MAAGAPSCTPRALMPFINAILHCRAVCVHLASWNTGLCWRSDLLLPRIYIELSAHFFVPSHPPTVFQ
jgi:hypothetical protein